MLICTVMAPFAGFLHIFLIKCGLTFSRVTNVLKHNFSKLIKQSHDLSCHYYNLKQSLPVAVD